jgi:uncharacterized protein
MIKMEAITTITDGVLLDIDVSTKSDTFRVVGYNHWRKSYEIKINAIPHKGKANKEIINQFSKLTNRRVEIISGHKSNRKTLKIYDINEEDLLNIINNELK